MTALLRVKKNMTSFSYKRRRGLKILSPSPFPRHVGAGTHFAACSIYYKVRSSKIILSPTWWVSTERLPLSGIKSLIHLMSDQQDLNMRPFYISIQCFKFIELSNIMNFGKSYIHPLCFINFKEHLEIDFQEAYSNSMQTILNSSQVSFSK